MNDILKHAALVNSWLNPTVVHTGKTVKITPQKITRYTVLYLSFNALQLFSLQIHSICVLNDDLRTHLFYCHTVDIDM